MLQITFWWREDGATEDQTFVDSWPHAPGLGDAVIVDGHAKLVVSLVWSTDGYHVLIGLQ